MFFANNSLGRLLLPLFVGGGVLLWTTLHRPDAAEPHPTFWQGTLNATKDMCFGDRKCRRQAGLAHVRCFPDDLKDLSDPRTSAEAARLLDEDAYFDCINGYMEEKGFEYRFPL